MVDMTSAAMWGDIEVPVFVPEHWSRADAHEGLRGIEQLARRVDAARIAVIISLGVDQRDIISVVARQCAITTGMARRFVRAARVVARVDGAFTLLADGAIGIDHLLALTDVKDCVAAAELLERAPALLPEDFVNVVQRWRIDTEGTDLRNAQKTQRSLTFYRARHGGLGMRAVFPALEGEEFRARLWHLADEAWRAAHPERNRVANHTVNNNSVNNHPDNGHTDTTFEQRCLDALLDMSKHRGTTSNNKTTVLLNVSLETLEATLVGQGPIALSDCEELLARAELYGVINDMNNIPIRFGRSKRFGTAFQKLLLAARSHGQCAVAGCDCHWSKTKIHHKKPFEIGGPTDIDNLELLCDGHHRHHHLVDEPGDTRPLIRFIITSPPGRGPPVRADAMHT